MKKEFNTTERKNETRPEQTRLWKITVTQERRRQGRRGEWTTFVSSLHDSDADYDHTNCMGPSVQ